MFAQAMVAMIAPRPPRSFGFGQRWAAVVAALLLVALLAPLPVVAQDDPFTATVTVDATADDVAKAREMARRDGQRKALTAVVDKFTGGPRQAQLPQLTRHPITHPVSRIYGTHHE